MNNIRIENYTKTLFEVNSSIFVFYGEECLHHEMLLIILSYILLDLSDTDIHNRYGVKQRKTKTIPCICDRHAYYYETRRSIRCLFTCTYSEYSCQSVCIHIIKSLIVRLSVIKTVKHNLKKTRSILPLVVNQHKTEVCPTEDSIGPPAPDAISMQTYDFSWILL